MLLRIHTRGLMKKSNDAGGLSHRIYSVAEHSRDRKFFNLLSRVARKPSPSLKFEEIVYCSTKALSV